MVSFSELNSRSEPTIRSNLDPPAAPSTSFAWSSSPQARAAAEIFRPDPADTASSFSRMFFVSTGSATGRSVRIALAELFDLPSRARAAAVARPVTPHPLPSSSIDVLSFINTLAVGDTTNPAIFIPAGHTIKFVPSVSSSSSSSSTSLPSSPPSPSSFFSSRPTSSSSKANVTRLRFTSQCGVRSTSTDPMSSPSSSSNNNSMVSPPLWSSGTTISISPSTS
mmetsp:Transcript_49984/g.97829  ORF Transcript_49984/g.97829 Transcript_49984/m.97829 type:complete len:223 (+) Transcript_49984:467-1135(+)